MHREMISVGLGILAALAPTVIPGLSPIFAYGLFGAAAILVLLGASGLARKSRRLRARDGQVTTLEVTVRKWSGAPDP